MDKQRIKSILKHAEGPKLDYKERLDLLTESGKKELAKDILAIANTQGGRGHILIGVKDKSKQLVGVDHMDYPEEKIQQIVSLRCDPPVMVRVEHLYHESMPLVLITVFKSHNKPHQMLQTGAFYVRRGSTTDMARRDEIAGMLQYNGLLHNEQVPLFHINKSCLSEKRLLRYLRLRHLDKEPQREILLSELGILHYDGELDQYVPTMGGLLLFCEAPEQYYPSLSIQWIHKEKSTRLTESVGGCIEMQLESVYERVEQLEDIYPKMALKEALRNAVIHRDYFDLTRNIVVEMGEDQVIISNPGAVFGNERLSDLHKETNPARRNHWLYHQMLMLDAKKRQVASGMGLAFIRESYEKASKVKIINLRKHNLFKIVLPTIDQLKQETDEVSDEKENNGRR